MVLRKVAARGFAVLRLEPAVRSDEAEEGLRGKELAPANLLAPFMYVELVWSLMFGLTVFGFWPDSRTLMGAAVIIASGLYIWHRERIPSDS